MILNQPVPSLAELCVLQPDIPWSIHFGMNAPIDFCVWILELDGLHVPPFACHDQRIGALQKLGLTPELWSFWATAVIALQNPVFYENHEQLDMDTWVDKKLARFKELVTALLETPA